MEGIARSRDAGGLFVEDRGELRHLELRLRDVIGVVQADCQELRGAQDRRLKVHRGEGQARPRTRGKIGGTAQRGRAGGEKGHHLARQLGRRHRQVDQILSRQDADARRAVLGEGGEPHRFLLG